MATMLVSTQGDDVGKSYNQGRRVRDSPLRLSKFIRELCKQKARGSSRPSQEKKDNNHGQTNHINVQCITPTGTHGHRGVQRGDWDLGYRRWMGRAARPGI